MPDITMCHSVGIELCDSCHRNEKNTKPNPLYQAFWFPSDEEITKVQTTGECALYVGQK